MVHLQSDGSVVHMIGYFFVTARASRRVLYAVSPQKFDIARFGTSGDCSLFYAA
jgi:hypothetical protein